MPPEFADVQVTLLLPEYIAALGEGDDSVGLIQLTTVRNLELRVVNTDILDMVATSYPALRRLKLVDVCYYIGCDNFGATLQHQLLVQCSLLAARCQHLVLFDVVRAGVEFTNMKMDTLSLGLVGPGFRCQCVVIFRVIPPRKSLADAIYYEARTTMFLKRLMDVGSPTRTRSSAWWMARHRNISLKSRSLPLRNQSVSGSWVPHKRQRIQRLWDRDC